MTKPSNVIVWMLGFLIAVGALAVLLSAKLAQNFQANPFFNGVILAVLIAGIVVNFRQVFLLTRDVDWIELFKRSPPDRPLPMKPKLLAPMARMFAGRERAKVSLSAPSLRSILDSVYLRLEESRDLSRYLIGLSIFLGLLGTFWGLLETIRSVADIIGSLGTGSDPAAMFAQLKENLKQPLSGMSTSFSTSLFGLASSLVLGFLDLQAGHGGEPAALRLRCVRLKRRQGDTWPVSPCTHFRLPSGPPLAGCAAEDVPPSALSPALFATQTKSVLPEKAGALLSSFSPASPTGRRCKR